MLAWLLDLRHQEFDRWSIKCSHKPNPNIHVRLSTERRWREIVNIGNLLTLACKDYSSVLPWGFWHSIYPPFFSLLSTRCFICMKIPYLYTHCLHREASIQHVFTRSYISTERNTLNLRQKRELQYLWASIKYPHLKSSLWIFLAGIALMTLIETSRHDIQLDDNNDDEI
jgi:hypothetical protein